MSRPTDPARAVPDGPTAPGRDNDGEDRERRILRRRVLLASIISVLVVVVVIVASILARRAADADVGPLPVAGTDQPGATTPACAELTAKMPAALAGQARRTLANPAPPASAAWGDPAAIYRCGVPTPDQLTCSAHLLVVNGVQWLAIAEDGDVTYLAADREVRVALTVPDGFKGGDAQLTIVAPAPVTQLSDLISSTLPARAVCTADAQLVPVAGGN